MTIKFQKEFNFDLINNKDDIKKALGIYIVPQNSGIEVEWDNITVDKNTISFQIKIKEGISLSKIMVRFSFLIWYRTN